MPMTILQPSFTVKPCFLNHEAVKLADLRYCTWSDFRTRRIFVKRLGSLGSHRVCEEGSRGTARMNQREPQLKVFASAQGSASQLGTQFYTTADIEQELENASIYLFRTDRGGQVKVYVGRKKKRYMVFIEVLNLPQWMNKNTLVLSWGMYRSDSSSLIPLKPKSSTPGSRSNTSLTPFTQNSLGTQTLVMEFKSNQDPFFLSFSLLCPSGTASGVIEMRSHRKTEFCVPVGIGSGNPAPLGISFSNDGSVNFALFSRSAASVVLCLYEELAGKPSLEIDLDPYINRTGDIWHVSMEKIVPFTSYGYRCRGTIPPEKGKTFHESRVLLDPYAKVLKRYLTSNPGSVSPVRYLGNLVKEPIFDWTGEVRPCLPMEKLVVYRLNVERFTKDKTSGLPSVLAGKFTGLIEKLHHFKRLGVNAVMLEPIFPFNEQAGPYFPYHFFSPMSLYGPINDGVSASISMKEMVKVMHLNKMEVLLEVVFTDTAECGDLMGIDGNSYYVSHKDVDSKDRSSLKCNYPIVLKMILDSLRHWVTEYHVDGFCFVNAPSLLKGSNEEYLSRSPLIEAIAFDPLLSKTKIIADSMDPYDLDSQEIKFPHWKRWAEINTKFCYDVRMFLRGQGLLSNLATRLCGSADIFLDGRGPAFSFNFITRNFGLPLVDLVSFSNNELSSECSWNCGQEGLTNRKVILETRLKQIRNFLLVLYVSMGVPVLNMGDEYGQSSGGSPLYSDRKSFNWDALETGLGVQTTQLIAFLSALRTRRADLFQRRNFMKVENVDWHGSDLSEPMWEDPSSKFLAMTLKTDISNTQEDGDLFIAFNASDSPEITILPTPAPGMRWFRLVDTALQFPGFFLTDGEPVIEDPSGLLVYEMKSHSCILLERIHTSEDHSNEWYQENAVFRVSLANFLFFSAFSLIMIGVKDQNDRRDAWHHGGWIFKIVIWVLLTVLMFFLPNVIITIYEKISIFGSGFFLLVQVIILLDFTYTWNDAWVEKDEHKWYVALLTVSIGCYIAAFVFSGLLFIWFNPSGQDCGLNIFFIIMTMILAFGFGILALHPQINGSLLPASVISAYCAYLLYSALSSEPRDYQCNGLHKKSKGVSTSTLVLGMLTTVLSVMYSAVRAGSSTTFLSPPSSPREGSKPLLEEEVEDGRKKGEARLVAYSYTFFHLIFALASMYSGMLLTGWSSVQGDGSDLIDVGWTTVWVRICTQWVTAALYVWSLVAPLIMPDREFF